MERTEDMTLTRNQVREIDRRAIEDYGIPALVLMENAGRGAAEVLVRLGIGGPVVICCGKGNNGGDGLVVARHLVLQGYEVKILLVADARDLSTEAAIHWNIVRRLKIPAASTVTLDEPALRHEFANAEWLVDALFGTGLAGPLRPPFDRLVALMNDSEARILAVDTPSGLDCDTGAPLGPTIRAAHTVTFVAPKKGFENPIAGAFLGKVHVVEIGAPGFP
jgi:NAD(P)H-hydrate epimerase